VVHTGGSLRLVSRPFGPGLNAVPPQIGQGDIVRDGVSVMADRTSCSRHRPHGALDAGLVSEHRAEMREVDLGLTAWRRLEAHLEPRRHNWPDAAKDVFDRSVAAIIPKIARLAVQPPGRQLRIGHHTLPKVGIKRRDLASARWPGTIGWRLKTTLDSATDRLAIQPRLPGNGGQAQTLPMQLQDHDELPLT